jgi:hypothetical protein
MDADRLKQAMDRYGEQAGIAKAYEMFEVHNDGGPQNTNGCTDDTQCSIAKGG